MLSTPFCNGTLTPSILQAPTGASRTATATLHYDDQVTGQKRIAFGKCLLPYPSQGGHFTVRVRLLEGCILRSKLIRKFALSVCKGISSSCSLLTHTHTHIFLNAAPLSSSCLFYFVKGLYFWRKEILG